MNIDRHNYEEFFLLYVDNELCARERNAVDTFVQQNPDLERELRMLQETVINVDPVIFYDKTSLLKDSGFAEMQESLVLYADGELPEGEQAKMASLLVSDKVAIAEWKILQQTKLEPDHNIVFGDKSSLYRTTGARVVAARWWRIAAAAVLLGFGIWTGVTVYQNKMSTAGTRELVKNGPAEPLQPIPGKNINPVVNKTGNENRDPGKTIASSAQKNTLPLAAEKNEQPEDKIMKQKNPLQKDNVVLNNDETQVKKQSNNLPKPVNPVLENINRNDRNNNAVAIVKPKTSDESYSNITKSDVAINKIEKAVVPVKTMNDINIGAVTNPLAQNTGFSNDEVKNNDRILYMDEDNVKRTRIGGLFRKLKRVIERNTNIKTGNGIKVAGFEIAIK